MDLISLKDPSRKSRVWKVRLYIAKPISDIFFTPMMLNNYTNIQIFLMCVF